MLKNCFLPVDYNKSRSQTCGEIICEDFEVFVINCKLCKIKIFEFEEFIQHFKNIHLEETPPANEPEEPEICRIQHYQKNNEIKNERVINLETPKALKKKLKPTIKNTSCADNGEQEIDECYDDSYKDLDINSEQYNSQEDENRTILKKLRKPKNFACKICNKRYTEPRRLQLHVRITHLHNKTHKCSVCKLVFANKRSLSNHVGEKHRNLDCPECCKTLSSHSTLKRHMLIHTDKKEFICAEKNCGKAFASSVQLKRHERQHYGELFVCEECGYKCRYRESLVVHKRRHTGENPFNCKLCDRNFGSKSLLNEHMATHETERRHICDVCGKSFNRPKALYHHKHLHLGVKKFVCKTCGQAYAQAAGLSAHMRKHSEEVVASFSPDVFKIFKKAHAQ